MDVAANTNFPEIIVSPWIIDPEKLKKTLARKRGLEIGNIVLNSEYHPYFDKVLEQAINFPDKEFKIVLYCTETKYDDVIMQTLKKATRVLKTNDITNLKFVCYRFDDKKKGVSLQLKIDEIKILIIKHFSDLNKSVGLFDPDYIGFHSDSRIISTLRRNGLCITTRRHLDGTANFSPAIICCTPEKKNFLCPDDKDVLKLGSANRCVSTQLMLNGCLNLIEAPFTLSLHDFHQDGVALTGFTWCDHFATTIDEFGNGKEGIEDGNRQVITLELLLPCHSLQESIDKYKPRVKIDMTDRPEKLKEGVAEIGSN